MDSLTPDDFIHHIGPHLSLVVFPLTFHILGFSLVQCGACCLSGLSVRVKLFVFGSLSLSLYIYIYIILYIYI